MLQNTIQLRTAAYFILVLLTSCAQADRSVDKIVLSGYTTPDIKYLTIATDTILVKNGVFSDTLQRNRDQYNYIKLDSWKWPRIAYMKKGNSLKLDFRNDLIESEKDLVNEYLLNKDSILDSYSARWDMTDSSFRAAWQKEFPVNLNKIDSFFNTSSIPPTLIEELKQMEYMLRGHLTANFISYQEKQGLQINRDIYDFVDTIDLRNERLTFHQNNRNFQYYYYLDKMNLELPDSIFPFAAIDTIKKHVFIKDIRNLIIGSIVKSGLYDESVNHDELFRIYEENLGEISSTDRIVKTYEQIQKLKPGKSAPEFGLLSNIRGQSISLDSLKGKNFLLSAWGTWCPYCKEELPHLKSIMSKYSGKLESIAISLDRNPENWKKYLEENDWKATHLNDPNRSSTFRSNYLISGTSVYYLIDKNGLIVSSGLKPSDPRLEALIQNMNDL